MLLKRPIPRLFLPSKSLIPFLLINYKILKVLLYIFLIVTPFVHHIFKHIVLGIELVQQLIPHFPDRELVNWVTQLWVLRPQGWFGEVGIAFCVETVCLLLHLLDHLFQLSGWGSLLLLLILDNAHMHPESFESDPLLAALLAREECFSDHLLESQRGPTVLDLRKLRLIVVVYHSLSSAMVRAFENAFFFLG